MITLSHLKQKDFLAQAVEIIAVSTSPYQHPFEVMGIFLTALVATVCAIVLVLPEQGNCKCSL